MTTKGHTVNGKEGYWTGVGAAQALGILLMIYMGPARVRQALRGHVADDFIEVTLESVEPMVREWQRATPSSAS
jgi:hypothetical protein